MYIINKYVLCTIIPCRSQSQISLKDGILKSFNANTIGDKKLPSATIVYEEKENSKPKAVVEVIPTESSSSTSTTAEIQIFEAPTNKVFEELKQDKTDNKEKSVEDNNNKVDVFSGQRFENFDIDSVDGKNPLLLKDYIQDICDYLFKLEVYL